MPDPIVNNEPHVPENENDRVGQYFMIFIAVMSFLVKYVQPAFATLVDQYRNSKPVGVIDFKKSTAAAFTTTSVLTIVFTILIPLLGYFATIPQVAGCASVTFIIQLFIQVGTSYINGPTVTPPAAQ